MSLFQNLQNQQNDINSLYQQFQQNPMEFLLKSRLNIPQGMSNPQQILQHLSATGQVPTQYRQQVNQLLMTR